MKNRVVEDERIILHQTSGSPYAQRARLLLDYSGLDWSSVNASKGMPRPDQEVLVGGYCRRIPLLQVGADIYCDAEGIMTQIGSMSDKPELDKRTLTKEQREFTDYCERNGINSLLGAFRVTDFLWGYFRNVPFMEAIEFFKDRKKLAKQCPALLERPSRDECLVKTKEHFQVLDSAVVKSGFMSGTNSPSSADFAAFSTVWYQEMLTNSRLAKGNENLLRWLEVMKQLAKETVDTVSGEEAILIASKATPKPVPKSMCSSSRIGTDLTITPNDPLGIGMDMPVHGTLVGEDDYKYILSREHEQVGVVHIHLPKQCVGACG